MPGNVEGHVLVDVAKSCYFFWVTSFLPTLFICIFVIASSLACEGAKDAVFVGAVFLEFDAGFCDLVFALLSEFATNLICH